MQADVKGIATGNRRIVLPPTALAEPVCRLPGVCQAQIEPVSGKWQPYD